MPAADDSVRQAEAELAAANALHINFWWIADTLSHGRHVFEDNASNAMGGLMSGGTKKKVKVVDLRALLTERRLLDPMGPRVLAWDTMCMGFIVFTVLFLPVQIGFPDDFQPTPAMDAVDYVMDAVFFMDVIVTFNTAYVDRITEQLVTDRRAIAARYTSFWLWLDLAAAMPFDAIVESVLGSSTNAAQLHSVRLVRILRLARLAKLAKIAKFSFVKDFLDRYVPVNPLATSFRFFFSSLTPWVCRRYSISPAFVNLLIAATQVAVFAHLVACFFFFLTTSTVTGVNQVRSNTGGCARLEGAPAAHVQAR